MAQLGTTFDATTVDPNTAYEALPPGDYVVQIVESSMEPTRNGNGRYLKIKLEVTDGDQKGKVVFDRLNLENPNAQATEIARRTFSAICHACGVLSVQDSEQLHLIRMTAKVAKVPRTDRDGNKVEGEFSNEIKGYKKFEGAARSGGAPATTSTGSGGGGGSSSGSSASSSTPPWKRNG